MRHVLVLIILAVATAAHASDDRKLRLVVHGPVDSAAIGEAIARELGAVVAVVGGTCDLSCLDVSVDGKNAATVVYTPRSGEPRTRTVALGSDTTQWSLVITLLAGNLVRDEARDVVVGLPRVLPQPPAASGVPLPAVASPALARSTEAASGMAPVAHPEAPIAPPSESVREYSAVGIGLVPGLSTDLTHIGSVQHFLSLNLLVGVGGGSSGLSFSSIADIEGGPVAGFQAGGVVASAWRVTGTQAAGVAAVADDVDGLQIAGVTGIARGTANVQIAGLVNVARRVAGVQIAPINVAREGDGIQIGVINVGGSADGFSFGLINIVPGGRYDLEAAVDSSKIGTVLFRHGSRRWHNVYGIGGHPVNHSGPSDDVWMYGLGFGATRPLGDTLIDLEAIGWHVNHGPHYESDVSILGQLRLSVAPHWGSFALVAGGILNVYVTSDSQSPLVLEHRTAGSPMTSDVTVTVWPSAFVGLRI
jgi:hypothetical protein